MSSTLTDRNPGIFSNEYTPPDKIDFENIMQCSRADSMRNLKRDSMRVNPHAIIASKFRVSRNALAIGRAALYHSATETRYPGARLPAENNPDEEALIIPLTGTKRVPRMGHHLDVAAGKWCDDQYEHTLISPLITTGVYVVPTNGDPSHTVGSGILQPFDWDELPGIVVVVRNPLDCLALWTVGICAVAVPNAGTGLPVLLNVIHFYGKEQGDSGLLNDTLKKRGWFWSDVAGSDFSWASSNAGAMKRADLKGVEWTWWTTCPVGDWVRNRVPSITCKENLVELGNTLAAVIEDNSADSGDMPESPTVIDTPTKCDTLSPESLKALVPDAEYRRCLSDAARSRRDVIYPMERLAAENAAHAAASGDIAEYRYWSGVRDWATAAETERPRREIVAGAGDTVAAETESLDYVVVGNKICLRKVDDDDKVTDTAFCNFVACITAEITCDDGENHTTEFEVSGTLCDGEPLDTIRVKAAEFNDLDWVTEKWNSRPNVYAMGGAERHIRSAIKFLSGKPERRTVYTHTGWRKLGGRWVYLTGSGAISGTGIVPDVKVELERLGKYELPKPAELGEQSGCVRASLGLLDGLAPDRVMYPLVAAMSCAVFGVNQTVVALNGLTGSFKSQLAALIQQHWGKSMADKSLPGSWKSTANFLEVQGHHAKDAVLVVDDFLASGNGIEASRMHEKAETFLRGVGNGSSRGRLNQDSTMKQSKPSQCFVITTGECSPRGGSLQARMMQLDVVKKMVDLKRLSACQKDAADGKYASAMASFAQWVAPQYETLKDWFVREVKIQRDLHQKSNQHARTAEQVAALTVGLMCWLEFGQFVGAVTPDEVRAHLERAEAAMVDAADLQTDDQQSEDPSGKFLRLLAASIASGHSHLASMDGNEPLGENGGRWGWRGGYPQGNLVGWVDGTDLYLEPDSSYAAACSLAKTQNDGFQIGRRDLNKRLETAGYLVRTDKRQHTVRVMLSGTRRNVLCMKVGSLAGEKPASVEASELFESL